jgi:hypothetical protein
MMAFSTLNRLHIKKKKKKEPPYSTTSNSQSLFRSNYSNIKRWGVIDEDNK